MKKLLTVLFCMMMVLSLSACSKKEETASDLIDQIKERGYITIATEGNWSPYTYHDEKTNELVGFDVELGKYIADALGVEARYEETDWDSILTGVESGRYDLAINGVTYSDERAKSYNFSNPYLYDQTVLIVLEDNEDIKSFDDLNGKVTTNSTGSSYAEMALELGAEVKYVQTFGDTIELLKRGDAQATINARVTYEDYMRAHPDGGLKIVDATDPEKTVIAAQKADSTVSLIEFINTTLDGLRADGTLKELSLKYFGLDATEPVE